MCRFAILVARDADPGDHASSFTVIGTHLYSIFPPRRFARSIAITPILFGGYGGTALLTRTCHFHLGVPNPILCNYISPAIKHIRQNPSCSPSHES